MRIVHVAAAHRLSAEMADTQDGKTSGAAPVATNGMEALTNVPLRMVRPVLLAWEWSGWISAVIASCFLPRSTWIMARWNTFW
ncbi:MAG TPA: hypothetical protein VGO59_05370 [Verrucomicrobiae bacterium]